MPKRAATGDNLTTEEKSAKRPKLGPNNVASKLLASLQDSAITNQVLAQAHVSDPSGLKKALGAAGVAVLSVDPASPSVQALRRKVGQLFAETFAETLPPELIEKLRTDGDVAALSAFWAKNPIKTTEMHLQTFGTPYRSPLRKPAKEGQTDRVTGTVYQPNCAAAQAPLAVHTHFPELLSSFLNEKDDDTRVHVSTDGPKILDGQKATPIHTDPPTRVATAAGTQRTQMVFLDHQPKGARRLFQACALTPEERDWLQKLLGQPSGGFGARAWAGLAKKYPDIVQALVAHRRVGLDPTQHAGFLAWTPATPHGEFLPETPPGPSPSPPLRIYCGWQFFKAPKNRLLPAEIVRLAFFRELHGYAESPFAKKENSKSRFFVNDKTTQFHAADQREPDPTITRVLAQSTPDLARQLLHVTTEAQLRLHGLTPQDLVAWTTASPAKTEEEMEKEEEKAVYFNSKSKGDLALLSNFFGGVEAHYVAARFQDPQVHTLLGVIAKGTLTDFEFLTWLQDLQPGKKWTQAQQDYWFRTEPGGRRVPIFGILAKLIGAAACNNQDRRRCLAKRYALADVALNDPLDDDASRQLMLTLLRQKFREPRFRQVLLATGTRTLHERPMRGKGNRWTYPGGDLLGQLLMQVRAELVEEEEGQREGGADLAPLKKKSA